MLSYDKFSCIKDYPKPVTNAFGFQLEVPEIETDVLEIARLGVGIHCPKGWTMIGGSLLKHGKPRCYFVGSLAVSQPEAKQVCEEMGATLAIVDDKEQNYYLGKLFKKQNFWIGLEHEMPKNLTTADTSHLEIPDVAYIELNSEFDYDVAETIQVYAPNFKWPNGQESLLEYEWIFGRPFEITTVMENYCVLSNYGDTGVWSNEPCLYKALFACSKDIIE